MSNTPPSNAVFHFAGTIEQFVADERTYRFDPPAVLAEGDYWIQQEPDLVTVTLRKIGTQLMWTGREDTDRG